MRIVFMGTGEFAVPALQALLGSEHEVAAVVSQPDKPKGRGLSIEPTPVAGIAAKHGIKIWQPASLKGDEPRKIFLSFAPDIVVVAAYGKILPDWVFADPKFGAINIHGSLLPAYRGAAPIQRAVMSGDTVTGITILKVAREVDTGDVLLKSEIEIEADETSGELFARLAALGAEALPEALKMISTGQAVWKAQPPKSTYAPKIDKAEAKIDWGQDSVFLKNLIRGLNPNPGAYFMIAGKRIKVWRASALPVSGGNPGTITSILPAGPVVAAGQGSVLITEVQPEGKSKMSGSEFARGYRIAAGLVLE